MKIVKTVLILAATAFFLFGVLKIRIGPTEKINDLKDSLKKDSVILTDTRAEMYEEATSFSKELKKIPKGTKLILIGDPVEGETYDPFIQSRALATYLPVEYQGTKGWIDEICSFVLAGTGKVTVATDIKVYDEQGKYVDTITIPVGATINIGGYLKKTGGMKADEYRFEYKGVFSGIYVTNAEVSPELKKLLTAKKKKGVFGKLFG